MRRGEELALAAMKKEYQVLARRAEKAKAEADENINIGSEFVAIHQELNEIISSGKHSKESLRRLDELKKRRDRADRVLKKDSSALFDKQFEAESDRDALAEEIAMIEFRMDLRKRRVEPHQGRGGGDA